LYCTDPKLPNVIKFGAVGGEILNVGA